MSVTNDKKWYIINATSGHEKKIVMEIKRQIASEKLEELFEDVVVPTEEVIEIKKGKKTTTEKKFFPGYILVKMYMNDKSWHLIKNIPKVTGFLGDKDKPYPITQKEADRIFAQVQDGIDQPKQNIIYQIGESIKIIDGPFESFSGVVEEIDQDKSKLKVSVSIFGRSTPVELDFIQVDKL